MKRASEYFKEKKNIIIVALLLALLVAMAFVLYGSKGKVNTVSTDSNKSPTEIKLTRILSEIDGVGKAEVMINEGENGINGVIIVCEGAYNIMTKSDILNAVSTALGIEKGCIAIYAMNK